jgi:hypothetical protein
LPNIGSSWNNAISTAQWKGARLRDILLAAGVSEDDVFGDDVEGANDNTRPQHVQFLGADNMQVSALCGFVPISGRTLL